MLLEKFGVTIEAVQGELADLHKSFLATRRILTSQLRDITDRDAGQRTLMPIPIAEGVSKESLEAQLRSLSELNSVRKRHLTALLRVLEDEARERDAAQPKLPLNAFDGKTDKELAA